MNDVSDSAFDAAKAAGGAYLGAQVGSQFVGGPLGTAAGGVAGSLLTGKSATNKAAATMVMANVLPQIMNGGLGLSGMTGSGQSQTNSPSTL